MIKKVWSKLDFSYFYAFVGEATLALTLAFYIILARVLGPEEYGIFAAAIALASILSLFIKFGLPTLINREIAAYPETAPRSVSLFLLLEGFNSLVVLIALLPIALLLGYRGEVLLVCYLAVLTEVGRALIMTLRSAVKGLGWFRAESIAVTLERITVVAIATFVLLQTRNLVLVVATIVVVRLVHAGGLFLFLSKRVQVFSPITREKLIKILKTAYPFALSGVLWILYYQVDIVMLKTISTETETGLYSASYRILEIFSALPRVVFYVIFNRFAKYQVSNPAKLPEQIYKGTRLLLFVVIPAILMAGLIQTHLISTLYGNEFKQSLKSLSILLPSLSIKMFGGLATEFLQATGRERRVPKILAAAAGMNIVINAVLIPQFASLGAAIATLLSECIMATAALLILGQVGYPKASQNLLLITFSGLILTAIPSFMAYGLSPLVGVGIILPCLFLLTYRAQYKHFSEVAQ